MSVTKAAYSVLNVILQSTYLIRIVKAARYFISSSLTVGMISSNALKQYVVYLHKNLAWETFKGLKWKNGKALPKQAYEPTQIEHLANILTHGVWVIPSVMAALELIKRSHNGAQMISALLYGATLIFVFSVSTSFHCVFYCNRHRHLKDFLHRCDRAMIYIFIAGSYFPWLTIETLPNDGWASSMRWFVWLLATLGIIYQQTFHEKYKTLELVFYIIMGVLPALPIVKEHTLTGMSEILIGGLFYASGIFFFKSDGVIPCAHAIWHLFVVMAAGTHYYAILNYLYSEDLQITSEMRMGRIF